jgi:hypothetical protein
MIAMSSTLYYKDGGKFYGAKCDWPSEVGRRKYLASFEGVLLFKLFRSLTHGGLELLGMG